MSISDRFAELAHIRDSLGSLAADPSRVVMERFLSPTEAVIGNRPTILVGTNNYLGLTFDPGILNAACDAMHAEGSGTTGSRMANGSFSSHAALEAEFAEFYGVPSAMIFSTGYQTNLGLLMGLLKPGDKVVLDAHSHACIYDGCRISGADFFAFQHNDPEDLRKRLRRLGPDAKGALVIAEGLYSMWGDTAPLSDLCAVAKEFGAWLMVDEAHSFGVYGEKGLGLCEEAGILDQVDFITGTFSKSLASMGGFCVSRHPEMKLLRYGSRPYIFTASSSPASIAAAHAALRAIRSRPELKVRLWANAERLHRGLTGLGYRLASPPSPVIAVQVPSHEEAARMWNALLDEGVYVNLVVPPAAPEGASLLRCSLSAGHSFAQIDSIVAAFNTVRDGAAVPLSQSAG
ncbi:MAG: 8-amino-7-oxononanoate synthase [Rhodobacteraceae bacterium CG17_big_fil_post_rev_8_21_14_2_50_63_15]|nr:MAG: 8-amino-7-oxononanoate synthase [Rhodobacteraceae bacterium CG17_big_fil_post_rev_8_21_14_2_50_63_15]